DHSLYGLQSCHECRASPGPRGRCLHREAQGDARAGGDDPTGLGPTCGPEALTPRTVSRLAAAQVRRTRSMAWSAPAQGATFCARSLLCTVRCPRTFYTDLDTLICKSPDTDLRTSPGVGGRVPSACAAP